MVPDRQPPADPSRSFSDEVEAALEAAMLESWKEGAPTESLRLALKAAARDARQRLLRAEEMLVAFKALEQRAAGRRTHRRALSVEDRARLIRSLIDAYYTD